MQMQMHIHEHLYINESTYIPEPPTLNFFIPHLWQVIALYPRKGEAIALLTPNKKLNSGHKDKQKLLKDKDC